MASPNLENLKREAARAALEHVKPGMKLGLGTGSTAKHFVDLLGEKVAQGFECICVPTSIRTQEQAQSLNIPLSTLDDLASLDLTVDGADEISPKLDLVKGGGGALLREKIVAHASKTMIVIADETKTVEKMGAFPLPIEVNPFGLKSTRAEIEAVLPSFYEVADDAALNLRLQENGVPYETDGGHFILDASFGRISDEQGLSNALLNIPGVVQHGLFLQMCERAFVATKDGIVEMSR